MALPAVIFGRLAFLAAGWLIGHSFGRSSERTESLVRLNALMNDFEIPIAERELILRAYKERGPESFIDDTKDALRPYAREVSDLRDAIMSEIGEMAGLSEKEKTQQTLLTLGRAIMEEKNMRPVDQGFDSEEFEGFFVVLGQAAEDVIKEEG